MPYQTQSLLNRTTYAFDTSSAYGYGVGTLGNDALRWETTSTTNASLNFSLWKGRGYGFVEVYQTDTRNLLLYNQLPISNGFDQVLKNVGHIHNRGVELTLTTVNIDAANGLH